MAINSQRSGAEINKQPSDNGQFEGANLLRNKGSVPGEQASKRDCRRAYSPPAVEYSVTCRRGKVMAFVNHLMDACIFEIAEWVAEDDNVTIKLQIDV